MNDPLVNYYLFEQLVQRDLFFNWINPGKGNTKTV